MFSAEGLGDRVVEVTCNLDPKQDAKGAVGEIRFPNVRLFDCTVEVGRRYACSTGVTQIRMVLTPLAVCKACQNIETQKNFWNTRLGV